MSKSSTDVPELVRYSADLLSAGWNSGAIKLNGEFVRYDQAVAVIAAKDEKISQLADAGEKLLSELEAAEAKLEQIEKQEAVASLHITTTDDSLDIDVEVHNGATLQPSMSPIKVYTDPVASNADLKGLLFHIAQLRHAYTHLKAGAVLHQSEFADGLISPAIRALESALLIRKTE